MVSLSSISDKGYITESDHIAESTGAPVQSELFVKGRQIIEYAGKLCHLSCKGYSFAIRHFRNGAFVEIYRGASDREKYLGLKDQIHIVRKAPAKPIADASFWGLYFQSLEEGANNDTNLG